MRYKLVRSEFVTVSANTLCAMHFRRVRHLQHSIRFLLFKQKAVLLLFQCSYSSTVDTECLTLPGSTFTTFTSSQSTAPFQSSNFSQHELSIISNLFTDPSISPGLSLQSALDRTGIKPGSRLLHSVFHNFSSYPKLLPSLYLWAEKKPGFRPSSSIFNSLIKVLTKNNDFDSAWSLIRDRVNGDDVATSISRETFAIMIRRYARLGMNRSAVRTFEFAKGLNLILGSDSDLSLFEILMASLCKEGGVDVASEYFVQRRKDEPCWVPSIRVYNVMLNGCLQSRDLSKAERLWAEMRRMNVRPSVVTYGILAEGYCRMGDIGKAITLVGEMKKERIEPDAMVYNPIIKALMEARRFQEALGMMERFLVLESGPTKSTYNALIRGFCTADDLEGANKILKMMISRDTLPTPTTYSYFFRCYSKCGKIEESINLYTKMIESGYTPDLVSYKLLLIMLLEDGRADLAIQVTEDMRHRGFDLDLTSRTMMIDFLCKMHRFEEAFAEFEYTIRRGLVAHILTFQRLRDELRKHGLTEMNVKLHSLMSSFPHSTWLPIKYGKDESMEHVRRKSIINKAKALSKMLKN